MALPNMGFWQWLVQAGLIVGDPTYYSEGRAQPGEYEHALRVAIAALGSASDPTVSATFYEFLVAENAIQGDPTYYSDGRAQPAEVENVINVASTFFLATGGGGDEGDEPQVEPPVVEPPRPPPPEEPPVEPPPPPAEPVSIDFERRVAELYPWLPSELVRIFADAWAETGDREQALARTRAHDSYDTYFGGNRRDDGSLRMTEAEWFATREAYRRLFTEFKLDPTLWESRFTELMEGNVSPNEVAGRLGGAYERIITNIPQVKEFYARQFGLEMTDAAIFASFLDPDIGDAILNRRISVAQVGGEGLARGFDVTDAFAGRLANAGVEQLAARRLFTDAEGKVPTLNELARRFSDPDADFDVTEFADVSIFGDATQRRRIRRLFASESSLFSDVFGTVATSDDFAVTGITAR